MDTKQYFAKKINKKKVYYDLFYDVIFLKEDEKKLKLPYIRTLENYCFDSCIEITNSCNQNCFNCFAETSFEKKEKLFMEYGEIEEILRNREKDKIRILISGGEPFLHPEIEKILMLPEKFPSFKFVINTNGSKLLPLKYRDLIIKNDWLIAFSLHGSKKCHNQYTRTKSYYDVLKCLENFGCSARVHLYSVLNHLMGLTDIENLFKTRDKYNLNFLRFILPRPFGRFVPFNSKNLLKLIIERLDDKSGLEMEGSNTEFISARGEIGKTV